MNVKQKERELESLLGQLGKIIVAYSGGVDSSLLAYYARKVDPSAKIVIAVSPSLANDELLAARTQAEFFNWDLIEIETDEVAKPEYRVNDQMRCYFCKSTLFEKLSALAIELSYDCVVYGANVDDLKDFRPGHKAAKEQGVRSPLQEVGLTKDEIRNLAEEAGLPSWDRPQTACLSSRFPTFQTITAEGLLKVDKAESFIRSQNFRQVRVRTSGGLAVIEVGAEEVTRLLKDEPLLFKIKSHLKELGYEDVLVEPDGYRQGNANKIAYGVKESG